MNAPDPICTIVLATYNRPKLLAVALESALKQTYRNIEVVVVNDGGCDVSGVIASFNDPRVKYIAKPANIGAGNSYNRAIYESTGPYIAYLADDDLYYPNHVETLVRTLEKNPQFGGAYSDQVRVDCELNDGLYTKILEKKVDYSYDFNKVKLIGRTNFIPHPCLVHRRDLLKKSGMYDETLSVLIDWDLLRRMAFYTDFLHVKVVTGEYFVPKNKLERITNVRDKDPERFMDCLRRAFAKRPPKPWDRVKELTCVFHCKQLTGDTLRQFEFIISQIPYPAFYFIVMDNYSKNAMDVLRDMAYPNLKGIVNTTPAGLANSVKKILNSYMPDSWLFTLDESIRFGDDVADVAFMQRMYEGLHDSAAGTYQQPAEFRMNTLYNEPWNIKF